MKKKQVAVVYNLDGNTMTVKFNNSFPLISGKKTAKEGMEPHVSRVKLYRKTSQSKRGLLGIKYHPSYYVGDAQIETTGKHNQYVLRSDLKESRLKSGDEIVVEYVTSLKK